MTKFFANVMPILADNQYKGKTDELNVEIANLLQLVPLNISEAVIVASLHTNILFMNSMAEKLIGYSKTEAFGRPVAELFEIIDRKTGKLIKVPFDKPNKHNSFIRFGEYASLVAKNGKEISIAGSISHIVNDDDIIGFVFIFYHMAKRRQLEERFEYIGMHDALTGLYNRACFEYESLHINEGQQAPVGLIMCDIDGLKIINDTMGHKVGDDMLIAVANILKKSFGERDIVARIGGDEFAVLLPGSSAYEVSEACQRIRDNVGKYNEMNSGLPLSVSLGFAAGINSSADIVSLFKEADNNMYKEKLHQSRSIRSAVVNTIMHMIGARDFITEGHCDRLKNLAELMAFSLGLPEEKINDLRLLAEFHDIGKVGIADGILLKQGPLTPEEVREMRRHCEIGQHIAMSAPDIAHIANWILEHHEWWNGNGYPQGIKGEDIPLECRILAIIDAYDAMTNDRPYRKAISEEEALAELKKGAGIQFDPVLVLEFLRMLAAVKIYVAASLKDAMLEIQRVYNKNNPHRSLLFRFGSSGALKQQIENGALIDVFIPAALGPMNELQEKDLLIDDTREELLKNKIVLITAKKSTIDCCLNELVQEKIKKIAVGNPDTVPAGKYAQDVLKSLGILDGVKSKLVLARDVRRVLKFVETENIDVGIVYRSDAMISDKVRILDQAPDESHLPVVYPVAIMKNSKNKEESKAFIKFLASDKVKAIFKKYGFI